MERNPFTPAFGTVPPVMAGREDILDQMRLAFESGPGNPNLSTILIGARGTGKTVCMSCISDVALESGWITVRSIASDGLLEDIYEQTLRAADGLRDKPGARLTSITAGPAGITWENAPCDTGNWRTRMSAVLDALERTQTGLLITVDEVRADVPDVIRLAEVFQLFVVERRRVALVMAGLPYNVSRLLSDKSVSFLRRSRQYQLGRIPDSDVRRAFRKTVELGGRSMERGALDECVAATDGFAYMLQLVGYHAWIEAGDASAIDVPAAERGILAAREDIEEHVLASTYRELSDGDLRFLEAMLPDDGESRLSDVAARMGVKSNYASRYKSRLLAQGVIGERGRSTVFGFDIPGFREYLERRLG